MMRKCAQMMCKRCASDTQILCIYNVYDMHLQQVYVHFKIHNNKISQIASGEKKILKR